MHMGKNVYLDAYSQNHFLQAWYKNHILNVKKNIEDFLIGNNKELLTELQKRCHPKRKDNKFDYIKIKNILVIKWFLKES